MRILDQRSFYSSKKLHLLGEWDGRTVLLEEAAQSEPFFRILLFCGDKMERALLRTPLRGRVLRQCELKNAAVRVLLADRQSVQIVALRLDQAEPVKEELEFSFCGAVTDACLAGEAGCFVRTEADDTNAPLYQDLKQMTGRSAFLFYCEPKEEFCVPVQDFRLADLLPAEIAPDSGAVLCGVHQLQSDAAGAEHEPPLLKSCVVWAQWERLHAALLRGEMGLPLQLPFCAEQGESISVLGREQNKLFLSVQNAAEKILLALELSTGTAEEIARFAAPNGDFLFVRGLGCCKIIRTAGRMELNPLDGGNAFVLPERIGVPTAWMEERYLLAANSENAVCYDTQTRQSTVYEVTMQLLPDGFLLS